MKKFAYVTYWLPLGVAITLLSLMVFGVAQQAVRYSAYSPQTAMAEDAATEIVRGTSPAAVIPKNNVDMSVSLAPFMIVYDDGGNILASSVVLDGKVPEIPKGVLAFARERRQDRVTWQPAPGVRAAVVVARYVGDTPGFVLAGRSLREAENLTMKLLVDVAIGLVITLAATFMAAALFQRSRLN